MHTEARHESEPLHQLLTRAGIGLCGGWRSWRAAIGHAVSNRVRVRSTISRGWIWEMLTPDSHVVANSEVFADRGECEADAVKQGLPVSGRRKKPVVAPALRSPGLSTFRNASHLWIWEFADERGELIAASERAYLTRHECEDDAASSALVDIAARRT